VPAAFTLVGQPERLGDGLRACWNFGPPGSQAPVSGMDFIILSEDKASRLYAFVNVAAA
jgi:hypothetical protein